MSSFFQRRTNFIVLFIAGAIFFTALGFFVATGVDQPPQIQAQELWIEGSGFSDGQREVPSFAPIAKQMRKSVVRVEVLSSVSGSTIPSVPEGQAPDDGFHDPNNPGGQLPEDHPTVPSEGSGVIIRSDGYILTNNHVVEGGQSITVFLSEGESYDAQVIGADIRDDLALIKVEPEGELSVAPLGDSDAMEIGDWVMAMGNPLGFQYSATVGVVSGKGRALPASNFRDFIQTDAAIYPGNSGGPLFNLAGEVIGINTAVIPDTNLGFAVPINSAKEILPDLLESGSVTRGYLGVTIMDVADNPEAPGGVTQGAYVQAVHEGAPAAEGGIQEGDVLVEFDGQEVVDSTELTNLVTRTAPDSKVDMVVVRDGARESLEITIGKLPGTLE